MTHHDLTLGDLVDTIAALQEGGTVEVEVVNDPSALGHYYLSIWLRTTTERRFITHHPLGHLKSLPTHEERRT